MNCETAREEMLVADLEELLGESQSELAAHMRTCGNCRARAATITHAQNAIASGLSSLKPPTPVLPLRKRAAWRWAPVPLAAAAALALLLVRQQGSEPLPNMDAVARMMFTEPPVASAPAGKQAMVLEKENMTIVWLFNEERL